MVKKKVGSITLAVGLITVGVLLFLKNFIDISLRDIYKYWPVLLIGLGLEMILFMVLYGRNYPEVKLSVDGLCIVFIIVLGVISNGISLFNVEGPGHMFIDIDGNTIFDAIKYSSEIKESYVKENISAGYDIKEVKISNNFGSIKVLPAEAGSKGIKVTAEIRVKSNDESKARAYLKDAVIIKEGEVTEISPRYPSDADRKDLSNVRINFTVYVPGNVSVEADSSFGDIDVSGIGGNCTVEVKNGDIKAEAVGGNALIKNAFGDIEVRNIKGKAEVSNKNGDITAEEIGGSALVENHFGDIDIIKVGGDLKATNNNGQISVKGVGGKAEVENSFGDISIEDVGGGVRIENKNGRIEVEAVRGSARISNAFGDIYYNSDSIENSEVTATTKLGDIRTSRPLEIVKSGQETKAKGKLGSGQNKVELTTSNGDINIE